LAKSEYDLAQAVTIFTPFFTPKTQFSITQTPNLIWNIAYDHSKTWTSIQHSNSWEIHAFSTIKFTIQRPNFSNNKTMNNNIRLTLPKELQPIIKKVSPTLTLVQLIARFRLLLLWFFSSLGFSQKLVSRKNYLCFSLFISKPLLLIPPKLTKLL